MARILPLPDAAADGAIADSGFIFWADTVRNPGSAHPVTAIAGLAVDTNDGELLVRLFDDTTEEAIVLDVIPPSTATSVTITTWIRAETAPGARHNS